MILASGADNAVVPRALRMNFFVRLIIPCCLPAWPAMTLPVAETLKRFLALDFVFILGISVSVFLGSVCARLGMPFWPAARGESWRIGGCGAFGKGLFVPFDLYPFSHHRLASLVKHVALSTMNTYAGFRIKECVQMQIP